MIVIILLLKKFKVCIFNIYEECMLQKTLILGGRAIDIISSRKISRYYAVSIFWLGYCSDTSHATHKLCLVTISRPLYYLIIYFYTNSEDNTHERDTQLHHAHTERQDVWPRRKTKGKKKHSHCVIGTKARKTHIS